MSQQNAREIRSPFDRWCCERQFVDYDEWQFLPLFHKTLLLVMGWLLNMSIISMVNLASLSSLSELGMDFRKEINPSGLGELTYGTDGLFNALMPGRINVLGYNMSY